MKKSIILLLTVIIAIALSSCKPAGTPTASLAKTASPAKTVAVSAAPELPTADKYFRFEADVYRQYIDQSNSTSTIESYVEFLKNNLMQLREITDGNTTQSVYSYENGSVRKVLAENDRAYREDFTGADFVAADEEILIMEPIRVGTRWKLADGSVRSITSVNSQVNTSDGKFEAIEIATERADSIEKQYYAAGIGLMKSVVTPSGGGDSTEFVLDNITTGGAFDQTVRFFFIDGQNEKMVYVDRAISLKTNNAIGPFLMSELKSPPGNGEVGPALTAGVTLLGLEIRNSGALVYINLSKEFTSEMNAGSAYESLVLHSLVNTVGNYFAVKNVLLEVEGKPYESGDIMFVKDETIKVDVSTAVPFK